MPCGGFVADTLGFEEQAAKGEKPGLRIALHLLEGGAGAGVIALDHRRLGVEEADQRLAARAEQLVAALGHAAGEHGVSGTGGDDAARQRLVAAVAPAGVPPVADGAGGLEEGAHQPDDQHHREDQDTEADEENHQAGSDLLALPDEGDATWIVGEPRKTDAGGQNDEKKGEDSQHVCSLALIALGGRLGRRRG